MEVIEIWTGARAAALQQARRLTNEAFAEQLGVAVRTVANWHAKPELEPTPELQLALDTMHSQSNADVHVRFANLLVLQGELRLGRSLG